MPGCCYPPSLNRDASENARREELSLSLRDEIPEADRILSFACENIRIAVRSLPPDGSWPGSVNYWGVTYGGIIKYAAALEAGMGTDEGIFSLPCMKHTGYFPIYFTPRGVPAGYNDGMCSGTFPFLHLLARKYSNPLFSLYTDTYAGTSIHINNLHSDWHTIIWRSPDYEYLEPAEQSSVGDMPAPPALSELRTIDEQGAPHMGESCVWNKIITDVLNRPLTTMKCPETGIIGNGTQNPQSSDFYQEIETAYGLVGV